MLRDIGLLIAMPPFRTHLGGTTVGLARRLDSTGSESVANGYLAICIGIDWRGTF